MVKSQFKQLHLCSVPKRNIQKKGNLLHSIRICCRFAKDKAGSVPAVGEDLQPPVEGGPLGLEDDVPLLKQAEATLLV